jgi:DNA-binding NarL/FixJ family response regulator
MTTGIVRVMVVDGHPMWRDGVARDLTETGYQVAAAVGEGVQALRVAPAAAPTWSSSTCNCQTCPVST